MLTSPSSSRKIENVQERALRILLDDYDSDYSLLLDKAEKPYISVRMHRVLAVELNKLNPEYMNDIFVRNIRDSSRHHNDLVKQGFKGITYGKNSLRFMGPNIWNNLPETFKCAQTLKHFKVLINTWSDIRCQCRMCKSIGLVSDPDLDFNF